jgi:hypothetical protein
VFDDSLSRVKAGLSQPGAAPESDVRKVRHSPRQNLVSGDLDVLNQDLQLLVADQCVVDLLLSFGSLKTSSIAT